MRRARSLVMAAEHERIQLEEELQIAHREQINALGQQVIHEAKSRPSYWQ
jgi:hypothetical protein